MKEIIVLLIQVGVFSLELGLFNGKLSTAVGRVFLVVFFFVLLF